MLRSPRSSVALLFIYSIIALVGVAIAAMHGVPTSTRTY